MFKKITNFFRNRKEKLYSKRVEQELDNLKNKILKEQGKVFVLKTKENKSVVGYYKNINKLAEETGFHASSLYRAYREKRTFKKKFIIECQEF